MLLIDTQMRVLNASILGVKTKQDAKVIATFTTTGMQEVKIWIPHLVLPYTKTPLTMQFYREGY